MMNIQQSKFGPVHIPDNLSFPDLILERAARYGDITALIDSKTGVQMSYNKMSENIRRFASSMYRQGLKKGEVVMMFSPNNVYYPITLVGSSYIGVICSMANPNYTPDEFRYMLDDSGATVIFTMSHLLTTVNKAVKGYSKLKEIIVLDKAPGYTNIDSLLKDGDPNFVSPVKLDVKEDVLFLPYSSGTTGRSKGVMLTHYNLVANIFQNLCPGISVGFLHHEIYIVFLPFYHIYAIQVVLSTGLTRGDTLVVIEKFDFKFYLQCIQKYKATWLHVVPPVVLQIAKDPSVQNYDLSSVHTFYCGGAPMQVDVEMEALRVTRIPTFRQGYGMTELSPNTHVAPVVGWKHGACGMLLPNTECKIRDLETGEALGPGKNGELLIRGPQVMKGYWRHPQATAETIDDEGWVHTGDIGHYDEDFHFYVIDRLKELIKWKGLQVAPADLEFVLLKHPALADAGVIGVPDLEAGEIPRAFIVLKQGMSATENEIIDYVHNKVAPHKRLRGGVMFLKQIPKSPSGKILRRELRDRYRDSYRKSKL